MKYVIGIDFGTLSARGVLIPTDGGATCATFSSSYCHGVMDSALPDGTPLPLGFALQHPSDYIEALGEVVRGLVATAMIDAEDIVGIGIDFTSSTILPIDHEARPLCLSEKYKSEPHAYVKLWKHHGAERIADEITALAEERGEPWLSILGGKVSCEYAVPKVVETLRSAPDVYRDAHRFIEAGDWLTVVLTGRECRSASYAGYKWLWNDKDGYPCNEFFTAIDPRLDGFVGEKIPQEVYPVAAEVGRVTEAGSRISMLPVGCAVSTPLIDAHAPMVALGLVDDGDVIMTVGTSGCYVLHSSRGVGIDGVSGYTRDAVVPGLYTYEAGQTSVGDSLDWFVRNCVPASYHREAQERGVDIHTLLCDRAADLPVGASGLLSLDWFNGNRSILTDFNLSGAILGLQLSTRPEEIYRAIIEGIVFGTRVIFDNYTDHGITVRRVYASGGISAKNEMMMQIYADVLDTEITVPEVELGGSRGSAIYAAVVAGCYPDVRAAASAFLLSDARVYTPRPDRTEAYRLLYREYKTLHDYFGRENTVMHRLRKMQG